MSINSVTVTMHEDTVKNVLLTDVRYYWYMPVSRPFFTVTQCCCPRGKSLFLSSDKFTSPCPCPRAISPWIQHWLVVCDNIYEDIFVLLLKTERERGESVDERKHWQHCYEALSQHQPRGNTEETDLVQQLAVQRLHACRTGEAQRIRKSQTEGIDVVCVWALCLIAADFSGDQIRVNCVGDTYCTWRNCAKATLTAWFSSLVLLSTHYLQLHKC